MPARKSYSMTPARPRTCSIGGAAALFELRRGALRRALRRSARRRMRRSPCPPQIGLGGADVHATCRRSSGCCRSGSRWRWPCSASIDIGPCVMRTLPQIERVAAEVGAQHVGAPGKVPLEHGLGCGHGVAASSSGIRAQQRVQCVYCGSKRPCTDSSRIFSLFRSASKRLHRHAVRPNRIGTGEAVLYAMFFSVSIASASVAQIRCASARRQAATPRRLRIARRASRRGTKPRFAVSIHCGLPGAEDSSRARRCIAMLSSCGCPARCRAAMRRMAQRAVLLVSVITASLR